MKHYLFLDSILTTNKFVIDLGGNVEKPSSDVQEFENTLQEIKSLEQIQEQIRIYFTNALHFRDGQTTDERTLVFQQVRAYLDEHFSDLELKMSKVAEIFNMSPNHFSTIFHQEFGETYRDYLGKLRINHAKELLRTTNLKCSAVSYQSGFKDPHYFSFVFKKKTGVTPMQFRAQSQGSNNVE